MSTMGKRIVDEDDSLPLRAQCWIQIYASVINDHTIDTGVAARLADQAVDQFEERFYGRQIDQIGE